MQIWKEEVLFLTSVSLLALIYSYILTSNTLTCFLLRCLPNEHVFVGFLIYVYTLISDCVATLLYRSFIIFYVISIMSFGMFCLQFVLFSSDNGMYTCIIFMGQRECFLPK